MAEEKKEEKQQLNFAPAITGALIGGLIGFFIGIIFPVIRLESLGLGSIFLFICFCALFGFLLGLMYGFLPNKSLATLLIILVLIATLWGLISFGMFNTGIWAPIGRGAASIVNKVKDIFSQAFSFTKCFPEPGPGCPGYIDITNPNITTKENEVSVTFSDTIIRNDKVNVLVKITGSKINQNLHLIPKCYIGSEMKSAQEMLITNKGPDFQGNEIIFEPSDQRMTSFRCSADNLGCQKGNYCNKKIFLVLKKPVKLIGDWQIYIGPKSNYRGPKQTQTSEPKAPYSITLSSDNDMPFQKNTEGYTAQLTIKKQDESSNLEMIELIRINSLEQVLLDCQTFSKAGNSIELRNIDKKWLEENTQAYANEEKYIIPCTLYVNEDLMSATLVPITIEAYYQVNSTYEARLTT